MTVSREIAKRVESRADGRCEYCQMHQSLQGASYHIEHIIPRSKSGPSTIDNLAWCCPSCNLRKSDRTAGVDPITKLPAPLFDPRHDLWTDHFEWKEFELVGISAAGCTTVDALVLNHPRRLAVRLAEAAFGLFPPPMKLLFD